MFTNCNKLTKNFFQYCIILIDKKGRGTKMNVSRISPNFKGLMLFKNDKRAINTDHIMTIETGGSTKVPSTDIKLVNGCLIKVPYSYESIIHAYEMASRDKSAMYPVREY